MSACAAPAASPLMTAVASAGFSLFLQALPLTGTAQGTFLSPLSIIYALSLALNGAGPNSATHTELLRAVAGSTPGAPASALPSEADLNSELGRAMALLNSPADASAATASHMVVANGVWTHHGMQLKQAYVDAMQSLYQATAREAVNGAADVNKWVSDTTRGMITELVGSDDFDAILANAIYFKGLWAHAFKPTLTSPVDFTTAGGSTKQVHMMHQEFEGCDRILGADKEGVYEAVQLPYKGGAFNAVAILPAPGVSVAAAIKEWAAHPPALRPLGKVLVGLPKFKVTSSMSLTPVLHALGVRAPFSRAADFSRMAEGQLAISDVVHKAVVEVDEEGTVAAAATAIMMTRAMPLPPRELIFNRPFAFLITHAPTGLPAFVGVVNDPSA